MQLNVMHIFLLILNSINQFELAFKSLAFIANSRCHLYISDLINLTRIHLFIWKHPKIIIHSHSLPAKRLTPSSAAFAPICPTQTLRWTIIIAKNILSHSSSSAVTPTLNALIHTSIPLACIHTDLLKRKTK